jgi:hypothetical protein
MKGMLAVSLFIMLAAPLFAQDQATAARTAAGCGADNVQFDVKTDKSQHPQGQVAAGKALVYVFEAERSDAGSLKIGAVTTRIGLDGQWVGANRQYVLLLPSRSGRPQSLCELAINLRKDFEVSFGC